jgi:integrase
VVAPSLLHLLREHRMASRFKGPDDFVFASRTGTPLGCRNIVRRGLEVAVRDAKIADEPRLNFHALRHTCASMLIAQGLTPAHAAAQLGHANPGITLRTYVHIFGKAASREAVRAALQAAVGESVVSSAGN